jgi:hypothetical protein
MYLFPTWPRAGEPLDGGLDVELAGRPGLAGLVLKGRMPLLYVFIEESHQRLFRRMAKEEFGTQAMLRVLELSRQTANVASLSMWRCAWDDLLPSSGVGSVLRTRGQPADVVPPVWSGDIEQGWRATRARYGSVLRFMPFPEELEDKALGLLPQGDGVGLDEEQVYGPQDLESGFFLSLHRDTLAPFPGLERYIDGQLQREGFVLARNYATARLSNRCLRVSRSVATIAAASVWQAAWRGLERPVPSPAPHQPGLFDTLARRH